MGPLALLEFDRTILRSAERYEQVMAQCAREGIDPAPFFKE